MSTTVYLDHHATTPADARVAAIVAHALVAGFGNPSSRDHAIGDRAAAAVDQAAREVAALVGASASEVVFTSGATEALNLALQGAVAALGPGRARLVVSPTEHPAVLETCRWLARAGLAEVRFLRVNAVGHVDLDEVEAACRDGADLLAVMAANNEIGTLAPVEALAAIAERHGTQFVCDAAQAAGHVPLDVGAWGVTMLAMSGHKLYGPPGAGALVVARGTRLEPRIHGGAQQRGLRPGTLNMPGIAGFGEACRLRRLEMEADEAAIATRRDALQQLLQAALPELSVQGDPQRRLAGNLHVALPDLPNDAVIARIRDRLAISTGAACSSGAPAPSHVLAAIGLPLNRQDGAFRFGLGRATTVADIAAATAIFTEAVTAVRRALAGIGGR